MRRLTAAFFAVMLAPARKLSVLGGAGEELLQASVQFPHGVYAGA